MSGFDLVVIAKKESPPKELSTIILELEALCQSGLKRSMRAKPNKERSSSKKSISNTSKKGKRGPDRSSSIDSM